MKAKFKAGDQIQHIEDPNITGSVLREPMRGMKYDGLVYHVWWDDLFSDGIHTQPFIEEFYVEKVHAEEE